MRRGHAKRGKPQPVDDAEAQRRAAAYSAWFMANVRREIAPGGPTGSGPGRVRSTVDEDG